MDNGFSRFLRTDEAASALEYAILAGVICVGVGTVLTEFAGNETSIVGQLIKQGASGVHSLLAPLLSTGAPWASLG